MSILGGIGLIVLVFILLFALLAFFAIRGIWRMIFGRSDYYGDSYGGGYYDDDY